MVTTQPEPQPAPSVISVTSEVAEVDADLAKEWVYGCVFDGQRTLKWRNVEALSVRHMTGNFHPGNIAFARIEGQDDWRLIDGQHRLSVVARTGIPATFTISRYVVANEDEVRKLYMRTDWAAGGRTQRDAVRANDLAGQVGLPVAQANHLASAMTMLATGFEMAHGSRHIPLTPDQREEAALAWGVYAAHYFEAIVEADAPMASRLHSSSIMAMGLVTIRHADDVAIQFWREVANNDGLAKGSPAHTLVQYLLLTAGRRPLQHIVARAVASCWNAHANGKRLVLIRPSDPATPITIRQTPFSGKHHMVYPPGLTTPCIVDRELEVQP